MIRASEDSLTEKEKSKLTVDQQIYRNQCIVTNKIPVLRTNKQKYYSNTILEYDHDKKNLFEISK